MKQKLIKLIEQQQKETNERYKFHQKNIVPSASEYFRPYFNGQKAILRKLKAQVKKLK